ncbi:restriction endonuclease subunit S [Enterococcus casseliflavus]|uniref:restriction endonuclease subunit S n=1 Tax=Enterococcus casseliflavus TaxID=37734 RepID=UPI0035D97705
MSQKSELVPKRRFKEFENAGDWEQRKLSEMANFSKGNGYSKADLAEEGHPVILYGRLYTKYETIIKNVDTFAELKEKSVISNGGEVIVPASGETPEDISRASVVDVSGVALGGDLNIIKTNSELDPTFLALTISNGSQQKEMTKRAQGKSVVHLHNSDLKEVNLLYPKLDEQVKIGSFFKKLDVAITLHQRKLDKLKNLKQSYLYQMFPQNGQKVPTLRFAGFSGDWGVHKLKDMASLMNGYAFKSENYVSNGIYKILTISNVTGQRYTDMNETHSVDYLPSNIQSYQILQQGDVLISLTGNVGRVSIVNEENCLLNQRVGLLKINSNVNQEYIYQCLNNKKFEEKMIKSGQGAAQLNISKNDIEEYEILLPSKKEQQKIGKYFKQLDETIEVQEQELEKLKNLKEAYLNEMFV